VTRRSGIGALLIPGLFAGVAGAVQASCLVLASHPAGAPLASIDVSAATVGPASAGLPSTFTLTYLHSVTRTPVEERYRLEGATIVQTEIRFMQHGPGLPTEADAGGAWRREGDRFVVTTARSFDAIAMRVHRDQSPRLTVARDPRPIDLAQWGDRAIALTASPAPCLAGPQDGGRGARGPT